MTVLFKELAGSPVEVYEPDGMKAERRLLCAYEDRNAVVLALLGGNPVGGPLQASYPGRPGVAAMRVRVEPFEKRPDHRGAFGDLTADLNSYSGQFVEVVVTYEYLGGDGDRSGLPTPEENTLLTYRMDFGGEYQIVPPYALRWELDSTAPVTPDAVPALRIPIAEHHVTWHRVLNPPWQAIRSCIGAVNGTAFLGAAKETVLFDGAKADRRFTGVDDLQRPQFGWRITYVFREKTVKVLDDDLGQLSVGWNHSYRPVSAAGWHWDRLLDPDHNPLYRLVDFSELFHFAPIA